MQEDEILSEEIVSTDYYLLALRNMAIDYPNTFELPTRAPQPGETLHGTADRNLHEVTLQSVLGTKLFYDEQRAAFACVNKAIVMNPVALRRKGPPEAQ